MCNETGRAATDFYNWIVSQEIRDYLRENHSFSFEEKIRLICGVCRSLEEKYHALCVLRAEAEGAENALAGELVTLYDWAFDQLCRETPGQVFVFMEEREGDAGETQAFYSGVDRVLRTHEELTAYIKEREGWYHEEAISGDGISKESYIEKWVPVDRKMEMAVSFSLFRIQGRIFFQSFWPRLLTYGEEGYAQAERMGISRDAMFLYEDNSMRSLPLPFQTGALVRLETPDWDGPVYGVLGVFEALGCYINMACIKDGSLKLISLSCWWINVVSDWQTIDWLRHADPSELPPGQELLAEMADYLHRLEREDAQAVESAFYDIAGDPRERRKVYRTPEPISLAELLENVQKEDA